MSAADLFGTSSGKSYFLAEGKEHINKSLARLTNELAVHFVCLHREMFLCLGAFLQPSLRGTICIQENSRITRTVFSKENVCPSTSLNRHIVKIDCIYNKLKVTIYL